MPVRFDDLDDGLAAIQKPTLFYAWQSDAPGTINRTFIRDAAVEAIKALVIDDRVVDAPRLDSDTLGQSGTPEIAGTIFSKIKQAGIFLGDVTLVGRIGEDKKTPNPNVVAELGYAAGTIGWDRVILVMNTHFGEPDELPFDLKNRRFPITYKLSPGELKAQVRTRFVADVAGAVRAALDADHDAVGRIISQLTIESMRVLKQFGEGNFIIMKNEQDAKGHRISNTFDHALDRLLTLGVIRTYFDGGQQRYGYVWTYHGHLVLKRLGIVK